MTEPMRGLAYLVIEDDEISRDAPFLNFNLLLGPARYTRKWRGKKFNIRGSRVIGVEPV